MSKSKSKSIECQELKNIQYKTLLMNGNNLSVSNKTTDLSNIDLYLTNETEINKLETWNKLSKTNKLEKINVYILKLKENHNLSDEELEKSKLFLHDCIDKKKLLKNNEVIYEKDNGLLLNIVNLSFNQNNRSFSLKRSDKRSSTLKGLPKKSTSSKLLIHNQTHKKNSIKE